MSQQQDNTLTPPWKKSAKGAIYALYDELPANLKSALKPESGSKFTDDQYRYSVTCYDDGKVLVWRNPKGTGNNASAVVAAAIKDLVSEQKVTNQLLAKQLEFLEIIAKSAMKGETFKSAKGV